MGLTTIVLTMSGPEFQNDFLSMPSPDLLS